MIEAVLLKFGLSEHHIVNKYNSRGVRNGSRTCTAASLDKDGRGLS